MLVELYRSNAAKSCFVCALLCGAAAHSPASCALVALPVFTEAVFPDSAAAAAATIAVAAAAASSAGLHAACYFLLAAILRRTTAGLVGVLEKSVLGSCGALIFSQTISRLAAPNCDEFSALFGKLFAALLFLLTTLAGLAVVGGNAVESQRGKASSVVSAVAVVAAAAAAAQHWALVLSVCVRRWPLIAATAATVGLIRLAVVNGQVHQRTARKLFHFLLIPVMLRLLLTSAVDSAFFAFAGIGVVTAVEALRISNLPIISQQISQFINPFIDARDRRGVALTHVHLILGVALPILLETRVSLGRPPETPPQTRLTDLQLLRASQGLLTTAVGDSFAALVGGAFSRRHKVLGTEKSLEGWLAFVVTYVMGSYTLFFLALSAPPPLSVGCLIFAGLMSATLELVTSEVDNSLLPLAALSSIRVCGLFYAWSATPNV